MSEDEIKHLIEGYLKRTERLLPSGFETDDLIEDLRSHINDSFNDKKLKRENENPLKLHDPIKTSSRYSASIGPETITLPDPS